jgi:hypothetical protein
LLSILVLAMEKLSYVEAETYLFRFMDPRSKHFWSAISDMLSEQLLFLNSRTHFNDPYDSQPILENDLSNSAIRNYFNGMLERPHNPIRSPESVARILEMKATGRTRLKKKDIENIKAGLRKNTKEVLDTAGLLSFSLTAENPLLWGHYAASFSGVCVIFRRNQSLKSAFSVCAKVRYVSKRPRLAQSLLHELTVRRMASEPYDEIANQIFFLSFLHKSDHWAYEQEARIFPPFHAFKKLPFDSDELNWLYSWAKIV